MIRCQTDSWGTWWEVGYWSGVTWFRSNIATHEYATREEAENADASVWAAAYAAMRG